MHSLFGQYAETASTVAGIVGIILILLIATAIIVALTLIGGRIDKMPELEKLDTSKPS